MAGYTARLDRHCQDTVALLEAIGVHVGFVFCSSGNATQKTVH